MDREQLRLRRAIDAMPEPEWQVFLRGRYRGLDYSQIAAELGLSVDEVERLLAAAMVHLLQFGG